MRHVRHGDKTLSRYLLLSLFSLVLVSVFAVIPRHVAKATQDDAYARQVNLYLCVAGAAFMIGSTFAWLGTAKGSLMRAAESVDHPPAIKVDGSHEWYTYDFTGMPFGFFGAPSDDKKRSSAAVADETTV